MFGYIDEEDKDRFIGKCTFNKDGYIILKKNRERIHRILLNC